jgi:hypothetical protein
MHFVIGIVIDRLPFWRDGHFCSISVIGIVIDRLPFRIDVRARIVSSDSSASDVPKAICLKLEMVKYSVANL